MGQRESTISTVPTTQPLDDGVSWWCKFLARGIGVLAGIVAMVTGVIACVTVHPICLVAGIWQIMAGLLLVLFEAPCCCAFMDFIKQIEEFSKRRAHWQKGLIYVLIAILPVALCFGAVTLIGSGLIFGAGVFYGLMALGKKADRAEMMTKARGDDMEMNASLVSSEEK